MRIQEAIRSELAGNAAYPTVADERGTIRKLFRRTAADELLSAAAVVSATILR
jgi:hypothetical protein